MLEIHFILDYANLTNQPLLRDRAEKALEMLNVQEELIQSQTELVEAMHEKIKLLEVELDKKNRTIKEITEIHYN